MNSKTLIIVGIIALGAAWYYFNNKKIEELKIRLAEYQANPPSSRTDPKWLSIVQTLLGIGLNVYEQFKPGGLFAGKLSEDEVTILYDKAKQLNNYV